MLSLSLTHSPGELQGGHTGPRPVRAAASVLLCKSEILHAGPAVQDLHTLMLHVLLHLADVTSLKQQLNGALQDLKRQIEMKELTGEKKSKDLIRESSGEKVQNFRLRVKYTIIL